jgi:hypothetical protein
MIDWQVKLRGSLFLEPFATELVMPRSVNPATQRLWSERFQRFSRSGLTVAAFCRTECVSVPSFYQWRKKLAATGQDDASGFSRSAQHAFVPVRIATTAEVEVHLPNGSRICLPGNDTALIDTVIAAAGRLPGVARREDAAC